MLARKSHQHAVKVKSKWCIKRRKTIITSFFWFRDFNKFFDTTTPRFETSDHAISKYFVLPYYMSITMINNTHQFMIVYFYISSVKTMTSITTELLQKHTILTTIKIQQRHQSTTPDEGISNPPFSTKLIEGERTGEGKTTNFDFFFDRLIF